MTGERLGRRQLLTAVTAGLAVDALTGVAGAEAKGGGSTGVSTAATGPLQLSLASTRTELTMAEPVELALTYAGSAESVALAMRHEDGSEVSLSIPLGASGTVRGRVVTFPPSMLKPGAYSVVASDGAAKSAPVKLAVHRYEHASAYFVGAWMQGTASPETVLAKGGWMYFTSDFVWAGVRQPGPGDIVERYVAARMKPFSMTVMGGGHQMDLDSKNDWGDPWVQRSVTWKMSLAALSNRLYPSAGLQAFDEPGLTWWPWSAGDGKPPSVTPFSVPIHLEDFRKLTGKQMPTGPVDQTLPLYVGMMDTWIDFLAMRLKYLEQAWWASVRAVDQVHAPFITVNQLASSYCPGQVTDGVDSLMNRPYRVLSGHGGYSEAFGSWGAVISARSYDGFAWDRPHYYLPMWGAWNCTRMRQEVWLPWSTKLEGIEYDPSHGWSLSGGYEDALAVLEVAEINRRLALVGDVMKRMPRSRAPVAVLLSHTQYAYDLAVSNSPKMTGGADDSVHRTKVTATMWRVMSTGLAPNWIDESEVVAKGVEFLKDWKVVYCPGLAVAKPELRRILERYVALGGTLVQGKDDALKIAGAARVDYAYDAPNAPPIPGDYAQRKHTLDLAPGFASDLEGWLGPRRFVSEALANTMLMSAHAAGAATYLLMGNNNQDPSIPRWTQMEPVPLETSIRVPAEGALYDLLNGGAIHVEGGKAPLRLAAGDGACWVHLPAPPGELKLTAEPTDVEGAIAVTVTWGIAGYLPFRLRAYDPAGNVAEELFRATTPFDSIPMTYGPEPRARVVGASCAATFRQVIALGANAAPGTWTVEAHEWLTGTTTTAKTTLRAQGGSAPRAQATIERSAVSVYFEDAKKILALFAGHPSEPPFEQMNPDCRRVFRLDGESRKRFAVFGQEEPAGRVGAALRAKGMSVEVNPAYEIVPFKREADRGGTGPIPDDPLRSFENVYAHAIVLPGHVLGKNSWQRGHVNRPLTPTFPGPGRAYVQWGVGGYQAGFHDVWVFGDEAAGVAWVLAAIEGKELARDARALPTVVRAAAPASGRPSRRFEVTQEIKLWDTPVGVGSSPDGKVTYALLAGGSVAAYGASGRVLWNTQALLQGECLAVSPRGDRVAVGGFPGVLVLEAASGKVLGGCRVGPVPAGQSYGTSRMIAVAWNDEGTIVAAGGDVPGLQLALADAQGSALPVPKGIAGDVMGLAFAPRTSTLLVGATQLTAVNATTGAVTWRSAIPAAQSIRFAADGATVAAGGWGKTAGSVRVSDGKLLTSAALPSNVGGVAFLPEGDVVAAVWGGTYPLQRIRAQGGKVEDLAKGRFAFHDVLWWGGKGGKSGLAAAEQGGTLWLFDARGKALASLEDAGTTVRRMEARGAELLVGRMSRVVQRIACG